MLMCMCNEMRESGLGWRFLDKLKSDEDVGAHPTDQELDALFDLEQHFQHRHNF